MIISDLGKVKKVYFVGLGGIGMSAIARMMKSLNKTVSGSDIASSEITTALIGEDINVIIGHNAQNVPSDADLVVYSSAVPNDNPELIKAHELGLLLMTRSEVLGLLTTNFYTIAVAGTHGKTTTSAMLTKVMQDNGLEPNAIVGGLITNQKTNFIKGGEKYFVVEACEYNQSYFDLSPKMIVLTNIEEDHLDYYKDLTAIKESFRHFISKLDQNGILICNMYDPIIKEIIKGLPCKILNYLKVGMDTVILKVPGEHNIDNAKAVSMAAVNLGIERDDVFASLEKFEGTWRRFEYKGKIANTDTVVYDDYAHHPTAVKKTIEGARKFFADKNLIVVFQPHLFSRTKYFLDAFSRSFADADTVIFTDIYSAREKDDGKVSSKDLSGMTSKIHTNVQYIKDFSDIEKHIRENSDNNSVVIVMGAGDIYKLSEALVSH